MVGALGVGDWIGGRFQIFDVHEGGMSLVYVVNDQMNGPGPQGGCAQDPAQRAAREAASASADLPRNAGYGCSLASIRISCGLTRSRFLTACRMSCSS